MEIKNQDMQKATTQVAAIAEHVVEQLLGRDSQSNNTPRGEAKKYIMSLMEKESGTTREGARVTALATLSFPAVVFLTKNPKVVAAPNIGAGSPALLAAILRNVALHKVDIK